MSNNLITIWFQNGLDIQATHMIIFRDTFDYEDYPVYILPGEDVKEVVEVVTFYDRNNVIEVYNLALPIEPQLN